MARKLVVFEGIDNSGKTTLSRLVRALLEQKSAITWAWDKEPRFSTEEADRLNSEEMKDEYFREALFFKSRMEGQKDYHKANTVLDRYTWSGVAYAKVFSPNVFPFVQHLFLEPAGTKTPIFKIPDVFVFVDTDVDICLSREPEVGRERLVKIREAYLATESLLNAPVIRTKSDGTVPPEEIAAQLAQQISQYL